MKQKIVLAGGITVFLVLISFYAAFSQEAATEATPTQEPAVTQPQTPMEPETQWVWGEVSRVDPEKNEVVVKYLDYETDQEKEITLGVDEKTTYENIKSLAEIKPKDTLSIDYVVTSDGKNMAKNISVEKAEATTAVPEEKATTTPTETSPEATPAAAPAQTEATPQPQETTSGTAPTQ